MIGRKSEKRHQLNAARRNEAIIKLDGNLETARYFERECNKARQFNAWNVAESAETRKKEVSRKAEALRSRRSRLRDLLEREEECYRKECQGVEKKATQKVQNHPYASTSEKLAEDSLYRPLNRRRIQSDFCETYGAHRNYGLGILKERNELRAKEQRSTRLSMENTNLRQNDDDHSEHVGTRRDEGNLTKIDNESNHKNYNERMEEYKENWRSARASTIYENENAPREKEGRTSSVRVACRDPAGIEMCEHRPRSRKLHDSHFVLGNAGEHHQEQGENSAESNDKYRRESERESVETKMAAEMAELSTAEELPNGESENERNAENEDDETDRACEKVENDVKREETLEEADDPMKSSVEKAWMNSQEVVEAEQPREFLSDADVVNEQRQHDEDDIADTSADRSDRRHFESEKSLPWMRMIPGDKNLSEQMFVYLAHNELKKEIQKLDNREKLACSKHNWDEALRLRDMRNRLDIAREKNLYRRDDLSLDPEVKKTGLSRIHAREKLLKDREEICSNSSLYSEEAKVMWEHWVVEDEKTDVEDARVQREDLMTQLEASWRSLAIEDKQRITDSFRDKHHVNATLENYAENSCSFVSGSR